MFRNRAVRLGSLCARQSVDPGSRGARRARGLGPLQSELPGLAVLFVACIGLSPPVCLWGRRPIPLHAERPFSWLLSQFHA